MSGFDPIRETLQGNLRSIQYFSVLVWAAKSVVPTTGLPVFDIQQYRVLDYAYSLCFEIVVDAISCSSRLPGFTADEQNAESVWDGRPVKLRRPSAFRTYLCHLHQHPIHPSWPTRPETSSPIHLRETVILMDPYKHRPQNTQVSQRNTNVQYTPVTNTTRRSFSASTPIHSSLFRVRQNIARILSKCREKNQVSVRRVKTKRPPPASSKLEGAR